MKLNHCYQGDCRDVMVGMDADSIDAWCAGPRSMDCCTETALTAD